MTNNYLCLKEYFNCIFMAKKAVTFFLSFCNTLYIYNCSISEFISCQNYHGTLYVSLRKSHKTDENVRACINFPKSSAVMKYFLVFVELFSKVGKKYFAYFK